MNNPSQKTRIIFDLGEFRERETPLTNKERRAETLATLEQLKQISPKDIRELREHYDKAKPKDKDNAFSVLVMAVQQEAICRFVRENKLKP